MNIALSKRNSAAEPAAKPIGKFGAWFLKTFSFGAKERAKLFENFYSYVENGIPLYDAIVKAESVASNRQRIKQETFVLFRLFRKGAPLLPMYREWRQSIESGKSFSEAIAPWVPNEDVGLISGGEEADSLNIALREAANLNRKRADLSSMLWGKLTGPAFLLVFLSGVIYYIMATIIPTTKDMVPPEMVPGLTASYFAFGEFFINWGWLIALIIGGYLGVTSYTLPRWKANARDKVGWLFPYSLYRLTQSGFLLISLSAMTQSNMTVVDSIRNLTRTASPYTKSHLERMLEALNEGQDEVKAMDTGMFPPVVVDEMHMYEDLDSLSEMMRTLGVEVVSIMESTLANVAKTLQMVTLVGIGGFLVYTIFSLGMLAMAVSEAAQTMG